MTTSLEGRLLRFLAREEEDEQRSFRDLRALPVNQRVLDGECIRTAVFEAAEADGFVFRVDENLSKFRAGDALAVGFSIKALQPLIAQKFIMPDFILKCLTCRC